MSHRFESQPMQDCTACGGTGDAPDSTVPFCVVCFGAGREPIFEANRFAFARFLSDGFATTDKAPSGQPGGKSTGKGFANKFAAKCDDCGQWVEAGQGRTVRDGQRWVVTHEGGCPEAKAAPAPRPVVAGLNLRSVPSGRYAVPGGDTRLKVQIDNVTSGKWNGWVFVKDGAEYGQQQRYGSQRPGQDYTGKIEDALAAIIADPKAAAAAYGHLTGRCCICNRKLEDADSVAKGIGPICEAKFG